MIKFHTLEFKYGQNHIKFITNLVAKQANASVIVDIDGTVVLVTVVGNKIIKNEQNFLLLTVNYQERLYAAGKIPGGFFKREGRSNESEIIISRLIDRPIRPLFPKNFINEIQIIATVISLNPQINPDIVAIIGASVTLAISDIPFLEPIGAARVGYINNKYILNPTIKQLKQSNLNLIVSGTAKAILMVESESNLINEDILLNAIIYGHKKQQIIINNINKFVKITGKKKIVYNYNKINEYLNNKILNLSKKFLIEAYNIINKTERNLKLNEIKENILNKLINENEIIKINEIENIYKNIEKQILREKIIYTNKRIDGRKYDEIRDLDIRVNFLPRTHGSALFTRGDTQALVTVTLGTTKDAQTLDELKYNKIDNFIFHYNFPSYSTGEIGILLLPKRREIGHGRLAKKSILPVIPNTKTFPYTIRVVSEITESNGSSSMASVCGASLALMDAGVPIKLPIAGIAMGLIKIKNKFIILTDIIGEEDYLGDMDFKVSGSYTGITSLQIDMKIKGITKEIINKTLNKAKIARLYILNKMSKIINKPRSEISKFAPKINIIKIKQNKIKDIIGKGGSVIRAITEETGAVIEIEDNGIIKIYSDSSKKINFAINKINKIIAEIEVGQIYKGKVTRIVNFGAFLLINDNKEGLVHISQIANKKINKVSDYLKISQEIFVKVIEIDNQGRIRLSIKDAIIKK
ncbi:MAG: polyribonucleotide nucleotidyltransferase [Enterobacteriaceae bacterium PSmelAO3-2]|nr:polyribonucleotide nucleotidyltransferase [Enterobacteriaceae bacterium Cmel17]WMC17455.1 MAG: polyribonucleotide nucleotidyltransferase [Enterobacteriaceae bacterium Cmel21]WMC17662.1 MAG: polyribonucleotide nucleotidyltransferase [Enterobacteriaceae bacterium PSmelAO3-2]WMC17866.1 MAG: polyribonucleotide nucleotidyltransferase [Enterobacteriaceae bacterium PSmelAO3-1]WMC18070.1 MAG: polyribonucleotide nucleotidyltransferase [Enterobacteriaceae bacterium PSmelAO1]